MPVAYQTVENVEGPTTYPDWSTTWPGQDTCGSMEEHLTARTVTPASPSTSWYEPVTVTVVRDDRQINGIRRGNPRYKYTPRFVSRRTKRQHLLKRLNGSNGYNCFHDYGVVAKFGSNCVPTQTYVESSGPFCAVWRDVTRSFYSYTEYVMNEFDMEEVSDAEAAVQDEASVEALTSYDILTDLAEAREIPLMVRSISSDMINILKILRGKFDLNTLRKGARIRPIDLLKHPERMLRKLGDEWMAYRYGIMPLVYSYRDIKQTLKRGFDNTTSKVRNITPKETGISLPSSSSRYRRTDYVGYIRVSAHVFQHFDLESDASFAGLGVNPLVTLWELIPYSFVADWFVNTGNYIARTTGQFGSRVHWACASRRSSYTKVMYAHFPNEDKTVTFANVESSPWYGSHPPSTPSRVIPRPEELQPLETEEVDEYYRWLFAPTDASLNVRPSLSWKRLVDSAVMTLNNLGALTRFLKG